jgi:hypothetical protein
MRLKTQTSSAISRIHETVSHDFELYNFTYDSDGGSNPYADGEFAETAESPTIVLGRVEDNTSDSDADTSGADLVTEKTLYVPQGTDVRTAGDAESETRASEFVDTQTGERYRAVATHHQSDLLAVQIESI